VVSGVVLAMVPKAYIATSEEVSGNITIPYIANPGKALLCIFQPKVVHTAADYLTVLRLSISLELERDMPKLRANLCSPMLAMQTIPGLALEQFKDPINYSTYRLSQTEADNYASYNVIKALINYYATVNALNKFFQIEVYKTKEKPPKEYLHPGIWH